MRADSPEDRLLRLIKGKHDKKADKAAEKTFLKKKMLKPSSLKSINKLLIGILAALSAYLLFSSLIPLRKDIDVFMQDTDIISAENNTGMPHIADYSVYKEISQEKELFGPPLAGRSEAPLPDLSTRFSLVGIIAGDQPQAIIEDNKTKKTHYLYEGQSFNGAIVEEIGNSRVVINHMGREITLVL